MVGFFRWKDIGDNSECFQGVMLVVCLSLIDAVLDGSAHGMDVAHSALSHISHYLKLSRRALLEHSVAELDLEVS